jgi:hypothetical protein
MASLNYYLLSFLLVLSGRLFGQPNTGVTVADINQDKKIDSSRISSDSGSGFGYKEVEFTDGKTLQQHTLQTASSFGTFVTLVEVPEWLAAPVQKTEGDDLLLKGTMSEKSKEGGTFYYFSLTTLAKVLREYH